MITSKVRIFLLYLRNMGKDKGTRNYTWLLHIAIWVVLFGMPFFSPRPGHPLHGGVDYSRFAVPLVSFFIVFYVNYFFLIKKYLYEKKLTGFILWNILLVALAGLAVHLFFKNGFLPVQDSFRPDFNGGGPGGAGGPAGGTGNPDFGPGGAGGPASGTGNPDFGPGGAGGPASGTGNPDFGPGGHGRPGPGSEGRPRAQGRPGPRPWLNNMEFISRNVIIYLGVIGLAVAVRMTERWYRDEKKRNEMEKAATEAELVALKSQVNPHFLFNTLNNIYSLIQIDQDKAQEAVHDLSGMLRYVLYDSEKPSVPLSKETGFLKDYIKLMSMRYTSNVTLDVSLPETGSDKYVAPLLFIPLVENAFKHGISTSEPSSIKIALKEEGEYVSFLVENTSFPKNDSDRSGSGIGVKNLQRRLDMLYPEQHTFEYGEAFGLYRSFLKIKTGNA